MKISYQSTDHLILKAFINIRIVENIRTLLRTILRRVTNKIECAKLVESNNKRIC